MLVIHNTILVKLFKIDTDSGIELHAKAKAGSEMS